MHNTDKGTSLLYMIRKNSMVALNCDQIKHRVSTVCVVRATDYQVKQLDVTKKTWLIKQY